VLLRDGSSCVLYPALGCEVRSQLAPDIGAAATRPAPSASTSTSRRRSRGLYAAGDVVTDVHQLTVATGHASIAATAIHNRLPPNVC
jgi:thioredoxin reductase (NADPH)